MVRVIHIVGYSGSGKTTIGKEIKKRLGHSYVVVDTDDIIDFAHKQTKKELGSIKWDKQMSTEKGRKYVDKYIHEKNRKHKERNT